MNHIKDLTVLMPVRVAAKDRMKNFQATLMWIINQGYKISVLEADVTPRLSSENMSKLGVDYYFVKDSNPIFFRTHYINVLLRKAITPIVAIWDADMVVAASQVEEAVSMIYKGYTLVYPFNKFYTSLIDNLTLEFHRDLNYENLLRHTFIPRFNRAFCGGIFLVNRREYLDCGGENEKFVAWGPEDQERLKRLQILGRQTGWINHGTMFHLFHKRDSMEKDYNDPRFISMRKELIKICCMTKQKLSEYTKSWAITL